MPKKQPIKPEDIQQSVMSKIQTDKIAMRPKWIFILGSTLSFIGLVCSGVLATFLINLTIFLLKRHGPGSGWRWQLIISNFPLWIPIFAIAGLFLGIWLLKQYDFSYKKNFKLLILCFLVSVFVTAFVTDFLGLNEIWTKRGPMRRFYQQIQKQPQSLRFLNRHFRPIL